MYLGIDIGGTYIKSAILLGNDLTEHRSIATNAYEGVNSLLYRIRTLISYYFEHYPEIKSVGIGIPGVVDNYGNVLVAPNLPGWQNVPLFKYLRNYIDVPFTIENDANVAAMAELLDGAGKGLSSFIYVTLGTGVGGSIIIDGQIYRGEIGGSGEIGHTLIDYNSRKKTAFTYQKGTLEAFIGRNAILELAKEQLQKNIVSKLSEITNFDVADIYKLAASGDKLCIKLLEQFGAVLGCGLASAMNLLDISTAIIGGGISQAGELILATTRKTLKDHLLPPLANRFQVKQAKYISSTGVRGAALLGKSLLDIEN